MNLIIIFLFFMGTVAPSNTFFARRSITTNPVFELPENNFQMNEAKNSDVSFQFFSDTFFQASVKEKNQGKYFFPNNKECQNFYENKANTDINSVWFGNITPVGSYYESKLCLAPSQRTFGQGYMINIKKCNYWMRINTNVIVIKTKANLKEYDKKENGLIVGRKNAFQALCPSTAPYFDYGNICNCSTSKTNFDDIQIKLGWDIKPNKSFYGVIVIPTGAKVEPINIFEPIVGSRHFSAGFGVNANKNFGTNDRWNAAIDCKFNYALPAKEIRSFDLTLNGQWSRYLLVVKSSDPQTKTYPGINLFTREATVSPRSNFNLWSALHYKNDHFHFEAGYNLWVRSKEKISKISAIDSGYGIADLVGIIAGSGATTSSKAKISNGPLSPYAASADATFVELTTSDLNPDSAAHPSALSNTFYALVGNQVKTNFGCLNASFGLSYEIGRGASALNNVATWISTFFNF